MKRNLAFIYEEVFTAIMRAAAEPQKILDLEEFRKRMIAMLNDARANAQKGYAENDVNMADLVVTALLDETVHTASATNQKLSAWTAVHPSRFPTIGRFAGEQVFKDIDAALDRADSADLADLLEVCALAILLGFRGAFGIEHFALQNKLRRDSLLKYSEAVLDRMKSIRSRTNPPLESGTPLEPVRRDRWTTSLALVSCAAVLVAFVTFLWFSLLLHGQMARVRGM